MEKPVSYTHLDVYKRQAQILSRRKKNNPILIGEPGVGKSAIVEGLALQMCIRDRAILHYSCCCIYYILHSLS